MSEAFDRPIWFIGTDAGMSEPSDRLLSMTNQVGGRLARLTELLSLDKGSHPQAIQRQ